MKVWYVILFFYKKKKAIWSLTPSAVLSVGCLGPVDVLLGFPIYGRSKVVLEFDFIMALKVS